MEIIGDITSQETKGIVYKNVKLETKEDVATRLNELVGFDIKFLEDDYGTYEGHVEDMSIFIYEDNTWSINYSVGNTDVDVSRIPNEAEGKIIAEEYLRKFKIDLDHIEYKGIDNEYGDEYLHLVYTPKNSEKDIFVFGDVLITLGENGKLISIDDRRIYNEFYKEVELISPKDSIDIATNVGVGTIACKAFVSSIESDYYYNEKTGYLIPTWSIIGEMKNENGDTYSWSPKIEAIKK